MPIVGHALVGLAAARCVNPVRRHARVVATHSYWATILVGLSYFPDIANHAAVLLGAADQTVLTHSFLFAVAASLVTGAVFSRLLSARLLRMFVISLVMIFVHDVLDFLQSAGRQPLWPFSRLEVPKSWQIIPTSIVSELAIFGTMLLVVWVATWAAGRSHPRTQSDDATVIGARGSTHSIGNGIVLGTILIAALGTHYLRTVRERDYLAARANLVEHKYKAALLDATKARPWPAVERPGRVEYLMAEANAGLKQFDEAERLYLASIRQDPNYFWAIADLAVLYASSSSRTSEERRALATPYVERLRRDFAQHRNLDHVLKKIERKLRTLGDGVKNNN